MSEENLNEVKETEVVENQEDVLASDVIEEIASEQDFNYVLDICRGFIALAESNLAVGKTVNIGSNTEISIGDTLNIIKELMESDIKVTEDTKRLRPAKSEVYRLWCDNSLIKELTNYEPQVDIREGLQRTINWVTQPENLASYKTDIYNV